MNRTLSAESAVAVVETRLVEAHHILNDVAGRLGEEPSVRRLLERARGWCILVGFYLAALDESWGEHVPCDELARIGSHAAERYLSTVGGALCGVLRGPGATSHGDVPAAVHEIRDGLMRILDALLHPATSRSERSGKMVG